MLLLKKPNEVLDENVGELEGDVFAGEFLVDGGVSAHFVLHLGLLSLVQKHLRRPGSVQLNSHPLAHDFGGEDQVVENRRMNGCQSAVSGPFLFLDAPRVLHGFGQDSSLSHEDEMTAAELLLQLTNQTRLNLTVVLQLGDGDENDDGLLSSTDVGLLGRRHVKIPQLRLHVAVHLQVKQSLGDGLFKLVGFLTTSLDDFGARGIPFFYIFNILLPNFKQIETTQL